MTIPDWDEKSNPFIKTGIPVLRLGLRLYNWGGSLWFRLSPGSCTEPALIGPFGTNLTLSPKTSFCHLCCIRLRLGLHIWSLAQANFLKQKLREKVTSKGPNVMRDWLLACWPGIYVTQGNSKISKILNCTKKVYLLFFLLLQHIRVVSGSEISQFMRFFSTNICTVQQYLEDLV